MTTRRLVATGSSSFPSLLLSALLLLGVHQAPAFSSMQASAADTSSRTAPADTVVALRSYYPSTLIVSSVPESAIVYLNDTRMGTTPLSLRDLPPDWVRLTLHKKFYDSWSVLQKPVEGDTACLTAVLKRKETALNVFVDPPGSSVYLDDKLVSQGSHTDIPLSEGSHKLMVRDEATGRQAELLAQMDNGVRYTVSGKLGFRSIPRLVLGAILPGSAQIADGAYLEGGIMLAASAALGYQALASMHEYADRRSDYDRALGLYIAAPSEAEATRRYDDVSARKADLDRASMWRTVSVGVFAAGYAYIIVDALLHHLVTDRLEVLPPRELIVGTHASPAAVPAFCLRYTFTLD